MLVRLLKKIFSLKFSQGVTMIDALMGIPMVSIGVMAMLQHSKISDIIEGHLLIDERINKFKHEIIRFLSEGSNCQNALGGNYPNHNFSYNSPRSLTNLTTTYQKSQLIQGIVLKDFLLFGDPLNHAAGAQSVGTNANEHMLYTLQIDVGLPGDKNRHVIRSIRLPVVLSMNGSSVYSCTPHIEEFIAKETHCSQMGGTLRYNGCFFPEYPGGGSSGYADVNNYFGKSITPSGQREIQGVLNSF